MVGPFEKWRADPLMFFFSFLLIIVVYMLKRLKWLSWQVLSVVTSKTWVRTPGLRTLHIIFPQEFIYIFNVKAQRIPSSSIHTRV